jgi:hypothetical protein
MKKTALFIFTLFSFYFLNAQDLVTPKFNLSNELAENSGLLYFNGKLITHNDSGGKPNLYEVDPITGTIVRTVKISNAFNIDWEDITEDETHIYISDSGNNRGNRTNLKIYKISKAQYLKSDSVTAEILNYKYENQTNFLSSSKTNFDAEALISYNDILLIFSKNRGNGKVTIYSLPKTPGTHIAKAMNTIDIDGQITGATYDTDSNKVILCGYTSSLSPFLVILKDFNMIDKSFQRIDLSQFVGAGNQVEGIAFVSPNKINFSRERFRKKIAGFSLNTPASVFELDLEKLNSFIKKNTDKENPSQPKIVKVINELGKTIYNKRDTINSSKIENLPEGIYYSKIKFDNQITINKKIIKE